MVQGENRSVSLGVCRVGVFFRPMSESVTMKFSELKRPDIKRMNKDHKVVVVPLGSLEQHGGHLPLCTDSLLGENDCRGCGSRAEGKQ